MTENSDPKEVGDQQENQFIKRLNVSAEDIKTIQGIKPHEVYVQEEELKQFDNPNYPKPEAGEDPITSKKRIEDDLSTEIEKEKTKSMNENFLRDNDKMKKIIAGEEK